MTRAICVGALAAVAVAAPVSAAEPDAKAADVRTTTVATSPSVHYRDGLLTVHADGVPFLVVLQAIEAETGLRFHGPALDEREVWKRFDDVPLAEGLRRVIGRQNFTVRYGDGGVPLRVDLCGAPTPLPATRSPGVARPSLSALWRSEAPVPVSPRVATVLGGARSVRLPQLAPALRSDDAAVRTDAVAALLSAVRQNATLRSAFVALPDDQAAALARAWAGPHAADVLRTIGERTLYGDVRSLAYRAAGHL